MNESGPRGFQFGQVFVGQFQQLSGYTENAIEQATIGIQKSGHAWPVGVEDPDPARAGEEVGVEGESPKIVADRDLIRVGLGELAEFESGAMDGIRPTEAEVGAMGCWCGGRVEEGDE